MAVTGLGQLRTPPTAGLVLAGGIARRMGGGDKSLRLLAGRPILAHVLARLAGQCDGLLLSANGDPSRFAAFSLPVVADDVPGFAGPLAGVLAGLDWLAAHRSDIAWMLAVPADTPFLPPDLVARLHAGRAAAGTPMACAASGGRMHPVVGLWPVSLRGELRRAVVEAGERRVGRWMEERGLARVDWPAEPLDPFLNLNTPEELAAAEEVVASGVTR